MSDGGKQGDLEAARARLETALSALTHGVANSRTALDTAASIAQEKTAVMSRLTSLEQENLKLHEQIAAHALMPDPAPNDAENSAIAAENERLKQIIATMEQEKNTIKGELDKTIVELETMLEDA